MLVVFLFPLGLVSMGLGLGTLPYQAIENPQGFGQAYTLCGRM